MVYGGEIEDAQPSFDGHAAELVGSSKSRLTSIDDVCLESGLVGRVETVRLTSSARACHLRGQPRLRRLSRKRSSSSRILHFVIVTMVPVPSPCRCRTPSMRRRAPGRPRPRPPLPVYPWPSPACTSRMPGPASRATTTIPQRLPSNTGLISTSPAPTCTTMFRVISRSQWRSGSRLCERSQAPERALGPGPGGDEIRVRRDLGSAPHRSSSVSPQAQAFEEVQGFIDVERRLERL